MNVNPFDLLKNAQKLQEQMGDFQEKLGRITATGIAGGGMVEIDLNGKIEVIAVRVSSEAASDVEMLQDLIMAAFANGIEKVKEMIQREAGAMASGFGLGGMPGLASPP